ncbi:zinc finger BED domain-containing protein 1-like [Denticeps clupeoides]|uniref:zinc finger BED domain-containing protein 1-like n=1 Tax=Denticeps clupeoides TaxID=299321 RepID=UPI0010A458EE|nr:zinc finger BED domain-containing protein 1 [Denticeps clupeoides]XP_028836320.1 zinc finger BED domain-containing protein 1 [Denticeps clupeoides]
MEGKGAEAASPDLHLVAHPRAKSKVWRYFGFDTDADGCILHWKRIYCRICMAQIAYSGNTSNLSYHLEKNHPNEFCEFVKSNTEQMREAYATAYSKIKPDASHHTSIDPKQCTGFESRKHYELTSAVLNFICEGMHPLSVVEEATFKALMKTADPRYSPPSRRELVTKSLPQRYYQVREAVSGELSEIACCGISTDLWQSRTQNRTYLTLSIHFLSMPFGSALSMVSRCLKTFEVPEDNTAEGITRALYEVFVEWGITQKINGATTNGTSVDVIKACTLLDLSVQMPCFGHTVNHGMDQAFRLPKIECFLGRCRRLVEYFQQSLVAMYMLRERQKQQCQSQSMLISDKIRSWTRTLAMLHSLREHQAVITSVLLEDSNNHHLLLNASEWNVVEGFTELLQSFKQVADMITACRYPTISMVKPVLHMLLSTTLKPKDGDIKEISMAKETIAQALTASYQQTAEIDMFLKVAMFLDPRYKKLPFLSPFERTQVEAKVLEEAKLVLEKRKEECCVSDESSQFVEEPPSKKQALISPPPSTSNAGNPLAVIFCQSGADENQEELHAQVVEELSNFKSQKVLGLNEDPLRWWSDRIALFPTLPKVLQKYWCVPATSVPCHRLFTSSGNVLCGKRNRLAPAHVDQQVFLYENLRSYYEAEPLEDDEGEWGIVQEAGQQAVDVLMMQPVPTS